MREAFAAWLKREEIPVIFEHRVRAVEKSGAQIGRNVAVGAGSVVTGVLPDFCVAVGNPARIIRRLVPGEGWVKVDEPAGRPPRPSDEPQPAGEG